MPAKKSSKTLASFVAPSRAARAAESKATTPKNGAPSALKHLTLRLTREQWIVLREAVLHDPDADGSLQKLFVLAASEWLEKRGLPALPETP